MNNKLLIPPSEILVKMAKRYGWKEEDLIKINLPRWDKYNIKNKDTLSLENKGRIKYNSILIMFTWRGMNPGEKISPYYFSNITDLITNELLLKELKNKNITLYFTMHRFLYFKYIKQYKKMQYDSNLMFINQREISETLSKIDLIITDFSSVVFDIMYRNKPFIIYFPDMDEPNIDIIYRKTYRNVIKVMKKNKFGFKNVCFNINETIKKIIYYVKNNFTVENELKPFCDSFIPNKGLSIPKFIEYLKKLT
jgi:CDP-glycerol glycerophosphotransferase (TagB/SpsB family)